MVERTRLGVGDGVSGQVSSPSPGREEVGQRTGLGVLEGGWKSRGGDAVSRVLEAPLLWGSRAVREPSD